MSDLFPDEVVFIHTKRPKSSAAFWCQRLLILPTVSQRKIMGNTCFLVALTADLHRKYAIRKRSRAGRDQLLAKNAHRNVAC